MQFANFYNVRTFVACSKAVKPVTLSLPRLATKLWSSLRAVTLLISVISLSGVQHRSWLPNGTTEKRSFSPSLFTMATREFFTFSSISVDMLALVSTTATKSIAVESDALGAVTRTETEKNFFPFDILLVSGKASTITPWVTGATYTSKRNSIKPKQQVLSE
jgi:hypothetical protein